MNLSNYLQAELEKIAGKNLFRDIENKVIKDDELCFSGNDYLGLAAKKFLSAEEFAALPFGSSGSRLTTGTHQVHLDLESTIARWKKTEAAIFFSSGYMANLGAISSLVTARDVAFVDELAHACILDALRLTKVRKFIFPHNDTEQLKKLLEKNRADYKNSFILTDSVFSMDGDRAPLAELLELAEEFDTEIYLDEAHGAGVLGETGAGLAEELSATKSIAVQMGTFSKAIGLEGGYVAGSKALIDFLRNKARTFIYSTAPSPIIVREAQLRIEALMKGELEQERKKLSTNIQLLQKLLKEKSFTHFRSSDELAETPKFYNDDTAIFALFPEADPVALAEKLRQEKIFVTAIRPPTVKTARLRISMSASHEAEDIYRLVDLISSL